MHHRNWRSVGRLSLLVIVAVGALAFSAAGASAQTAAYTCGWNEQYTLTEIGWNNGPWGSYTADGSGTCRGGLSNGISGAVGLGLPSYTTSDNGNWSSLDTSYSAFTCTAAHADIAGVNHSLSGQACFKSTAAQRRPTTSPFLTR
jgi:hypothetical protein